MDPKTNFDFIYHIIINTREIKESQMEREREIGEEGKKSNTVIRFICCNWGSFNAPNQTPVMAAINLPTIT